MRRIDPADRRCKEWQTRPMDGPGRAMAAEGADAWIAALSSGTARPSRSRPRRAPRRGAPPAAARSRRPPRPPAPEAGGGVRPAPDRLLPVVRLRAGPAVLGGIGLKKFSLEDGTPGRMRHRVRCGPARHPGRPSQPGGRREIRRREGIQASGAGDRTMDPPRAFGRHSRPLLAAPHVASSRGGPARKGSRVESAVGAWTSSVARMEPREGDGGPGTAGTRTRACEAVRPAESRPTDPCVSFE